MFGTVFCQLTQNPPTYAYLQALTQPSVTCKLLIVWDSHRLKRLATAATFKRVLPNEGADGIVIRITTTLGNKP